MLWPTSEPSSRSAWPRERSPPRVLSRNGALHRLNWGCLHRHADSEGARQHPDPVCRRRAELLAVDVSDRRPIQLDVDFSRLAQQRARHGGLAAPNAQVTPPGARILAHVLAGARYGEHADETVGAVVVGVEAELAGVDRRVDHRDSVEASAFFAAVDDEFRASAVP